MHCQEFEDRLNAVLDDRGSPTADARLAAHVANCDGCRQLLADHATLFAGLSRIPPPALKRDFARRVVAAAVPAMPRVVARPLAGRMWLALGTALTAAAAMLLAISLVWQARARRPELAGKSEPNNASIVMAPMSGADLLLEAPRLSGHWRTYRGAIDDFAVAFPGGLRLDEMEQLAPGIRPLRASLAMIWDTLCRTIPTQRGDSLPPQRERTSLWWLEPMRVA